MQSLLAELRRAVAAVWARVLALLQSLFGVASGGGGGASGAGGTGGASWTTGVLGLAALLVVIYHFTARWTPPTNDECLYPYGGRLPELMPFLKFLGVYGVNLFFLISGFVMIMTLERCGGLVDFIVRRASRLWPTMLVCATLTTLIMNGSRIFQRFESIRGWEVRPLEYLASIFFVDPNLIGRLLRIEGLQWVDGVYWTLWVEVRFYALVAVVFWLCGSTRRFAWGWLAVEATSLLAIILEAVQSPWTHWTLKLILQPDYLSWFTIGIAAYFYWHGKVTLPVALMALISLLGLIALGVTQHTGNLARVLILDAAILATFAVVIFRTPLANVFRMRWAVILGLASYPLYMFHEQAGVTLMNALTDWHVPLLLIPFAVVAGLVGVAIAMHHLVELPAKAILLAIGIPLAKKAEARLPWLRFRRA